MLAFICVFCASQAHAAIAHVQTKGQEFGSVSSASLTFNNGTTSGNLIVVCITSYKSGTAATYTVSDNKGNTYTEAGSITGGTNFSAHIFYAKNITGGASHQVTITPNAAAVPSFSISEFSGADTANPFDRENGATGTGTSADSGNITTTAAGLVIGVVTHNGATMTLTPGGSFTQAFEDETASGTMPINSEYKIVAASAYSADWTLASNTAWDAVVTSFKAAAGGGGGSGNETITYFHTDAIGSVRMITDDNGQVIARYDYLPFGEPCGAACGTQGAPDARQFGGKERDQETGLDYFGARYYASGSGRFTTVDPAIDIESALMNPQHWNRYTYVANNPLRWTDADGRCTDVLSCTVEFAEGGAALCGPYCGFAGAVVGIAAGAYVVHRLANEYNLYSEDQQAKAEPAQGASSRSGEPPQLKAGKEAHANEEVRPGESREVPTASRKGRMDRYDPDKAHIREIKPDNPRGEREGLKQLERYKKDQEEATKRPHTTELTKYRTKKPSDPDEPQ